MVDTNIKRQELLENIMNESRKKKLTIEFKKRELKRNIPIYNLQIQNGKMKNVQTFHYIGIFF